MQYGFPGMQVEEATEILKSIKEAVESKKVKVEGNKMAIATINAVGGTYYKGTQLDFLVKNIEKQLDDTRQENAITII